MSPDLAQAIERAIPGERVLLLRGVARRHLAVRDALLARGPGNSRGSKGALTRAVRGLAKVRALAVWLGAQLAPGALEIADPATFRLSPGGDPLAHRRGGAVHA